MNHIRKKATAKYLKVILCMAILITFCSVLYARFLNPQSSHAESLYMTATVEDDNGTVDFSPGTSGAVAEFSYVEVGQYGANSKNYDVKITLQSLPVGNKKLSVKLPIGMIWVDDGSSDSNLRSQLDENICNGGLQTIAVDQEPVLGYTFSKTSTKLYCFNEGTSAVTLNLKVKADSALDINFIENAIVADVIIDDQIKETASININVPSGESQGGYFYTSSRTIYVKAGTTHQSYEGNYRLQRPVSVLGNNFDIKRLIKNVRFVMTVDDPGLRIILQGADATWSIDDSRADDGVYIIDWTPTEYENGNRAMPYALVVPADAEVGKVYTVSSTAATTFWQEDGNDKVVNYKNTQTIKYQLLPTEELVTVGWADLNPSATETAHNTSYSTSVYANTDTQGTLGKGYINNKGSSDSARKRIHFKFDNTILGVMGIELPCEPNGTIGTVSVKTMSGVSKDVNLNKSCNQYGSANMLSFSNFGLEYGDYVSELEYDFGVIPAGTQIHQTASNSVAFAYIGKLLSEDRAGVATVELFDIDNPANTTGEASISTKKRNYGTLDITNLGTQVVDAGSPLKFSINVSNWAGGTGYDNTVLNPVIYIRQEVKDAEGNFLPISNLKITNGAARGGEDITSLFGQITHIDTPTARVYKIDGRNVPDGSASLSAVYVTQNGEIKNNIGITVSWSVDTSLTTPDQQYNIADMVFVQDPAHTGSITTHYMRGDPFNVSGSPNNTIYAATTNYYQIRGQSSIGVENSGKHTDSESWLTWDEDSNPITIGSADGSRADMKATMINNSGVAVPGPTTIYFPIPKKGQNWGSLNYNNQAFEFSTALTGAISNPNASYFSVSYGKEVTPTDNGSDLDAQNAKFVSDTSGWTSADWKDVNCVKITAANIPANSPSSADRYDFVYQLKVTDSANASDGAIDTWRPIYFQQLTNSAGDIFSGWYKGSYVSVKLAEGRVSGQLFIDANENGKKDTDEQELKESGWKIDLYDRSSNQLVRSTTTDANGAYSFIELALSADGYYITITNKHPINGDVTPLYLFSKKGSASNSGAYNTDNQAEGSKTTNPAHATAYIGPITPSGTAGEASYNIGLVEYIANEDYSGGVTFSDQNNAFSTRPATVTITATASDGSTQDITVQTDGDGNFVASLPKYNATADRLSYTFSAPDITGYTKSDSAGDHIYNVSYTLKTVTLTVNHYKKDTTDKLADTVTSTPYWGQPYSTFQATVDPNYEFDSTSGDAVSGNSTKDSITVNYYYKLKRGTVATHYYLKGTTTKIADDVTREYDYTSTYTTSPLVSIPDEYKYYELVSSQPTGYAGTVDRPSIEVTYYYQLKTGTLTVHHYLSGTTTKVADDEVSTKDYGTQYDTAYKTDLDNFIYDSTSGDASGTFKGDTTVIYYYKHRVGTIVTHYYLKGTTTRIADDVTEIKNYTESYETHPLATVPAQYQDYELVSDQPANYKGIVSQPTVEVSYYYQKKDAKLSSSLKLIAPKTINNKKAPVDYTINYSATVKDYIGPVQVNLTLKLPYPIDETASDFNGGVYDATTNTISWTRAQDFNSYTDGENLSMNRTISIVYIGAEPRDQLLATAEASIILDAKDNAAADSAETLVRTPAKIVYHFVDNNGNIIMEEHEDDGYVGDQSEYAPPVIPGYKLIKEQNIDNSFGEEQKSITYRYEKLPNPVTSTGSIIEYLLLASGLSVLLVATGAIVAKRRIH